MTATTIARPPTAEPLSRRRTRIAGGVGGVILAVYVAMLLFGSQLAPFRATELSGDSLEAPGGHHRNGGLYEINIRLALPEGREVNIGRTPQSDERHADLAYALNDAFKRARRQLQDQVDRMSGNVKTHARP